MCSRDWTKSLDIDVYLCISIWEKAKDRTVRRHTLSTTLLTVTCTYRPAHIGYGSVQSCTIARIVYVFIFGYSCSLLMLQKSYINPFGYHRLFVALRIVQLRKYIHTVLTFIHVGLRTIVLTLYIQAIILA